MARAALRLAVTLMLALVASMPAARAQDNFLFEDPVDRRALIVGVRHYDATSEVPSAHRDIELVERDLIALDFDVKKVTDPKANDLWGAVFRFISQVEEGDLAVFYYSGHGFQHDGGSFLVPADAPDMIETDTLTSAVVSLETVLDDLRKRRPGFSLAVLDACRENSLRIVPPDGTPKAVGRGLASPPPQTGSGVLIAYAASSGHIAFSSDDPSEPSLYTKHLVRHVDRTGADIANIFNLVAANVQRERDDQIPETRLIGSGTFYPRPDDLARERERRSFEAALETQDPSEVQHFLRLWPVGRFARAARKWLKAYSPHGMRAASAGGLFWLEERHALLRELSMTTSSVFSASPWAQATTAHDAVVFAEPRPGSAHVASVGPGAPLKIRPVQVRFEEGRRQHEEEDDVGQSEVVWSEVVVDPGQETERRGYLPLQIQVLDVEDQTTLRLRPTSKEDVDIDEVILVASERRFWFDEALPNTHLDSLGALVRTGEYSSLRDVELGRAVARVTLSPFVQGARSINEASQIAFLRAHQIRRALIKSGLPPWNISVELPSEFSLDPERGAKFEELILITPEN